MELSKFVLSPELSEKGVWVTFDDAQFLLASTRTKKFRDAQKTLIKVAQRKNEGVLDDDQVEALSIDVMAENVILGWKNVSYNGSPLPFTAANAKFVLENSEYIRKFIDTMAGTMELFSQSQAAESAKKLGEGSHGI